MPTESVQNADCAAQKKLGCDPASKKCVAYAINYVDVNGNCQPSTTTASYNICKGDAHCNGTVGTSGPATYVWAAGRPAGQPGNNITESCGAGLECTSSVCQSPMTPLACK